MANKKETQPADLETYSHEPVQERLGLFEHEKQFEAARDYYLNRYGPISALPPSIAESPLLTKLSKNEMAEAIILLGLDSSEQGIFWLAQLMYALPLPQWWALAKTTAEKPGVVFTYKQKETIMYPPGIVFVDSIIERIRSMNYKEVDRLAKSQYVFEGSGGRKETFTSDDVAAVAETEKNRLRNSRPSLRGFWLDMLQRSEESRFYREFPPMGTLVYNQAEQAIKGSYTEYKQTGGLEEQKMHQLLKDKHQKELAEQREAKEFLHAMKDWASAKSRFESELVRKNAQAYVGSKFDQRAFRLNAKPPVMNPRQYSAQTRILTAGTKGPGLSTAAGTNMSNAPVAALRPLTGTTIFKMQSAKLVPASIYRKTSSRQLPPMEGSAATAAKAAHKAAALMNTSFESSVEIEEDVDELDPNNEDMLNKIDKQFKGPQVMDARREGRMIRTATYTEKKDVKLAAQPPAGLDDVILLEEDKILQTRLQQVRSAHKFMSAEDGPQESEVPIDLTGNTGIRKGLRTMSVYGQKNTVHEVISRPFTALLQNDEIKFARNNELREIEMVKRRLNKNDVCDEINLDQRPAAQARDCSGHS